MATVRPGVFPKAKALPDRKGEVKYVELSGELLESALKVVERVKAPEKGVDITKAKAIVAGGRGLGNKEFFEKLFELAELLGGAVGATRPVCHLGWVSEDHMIGVSGVSVAPKLYLGLGISGALHHVVGLRGAVTIVAINTDPEAPLMQRADIAVEGDVREILPLLLQRLKGIKGVDVPIPAE
jgi:electron transfer flavoprotein alpha subunit